MKKIVRLTENDLMRIVKRVISEDEESNPSKTSIENFLNLMGKGYFSMNLVQFGKQDFKTKPPFIAEPIAPKIKFTFLGLGNAIQDGPQLFRGTHKKYRDFVYIFLDERYLNTTPKAWIFHVKSGTSGLYDLNTQFKEFESYIKNQLIWD